MTHKQILDKLADDRLVDALDGEVRRITWMAMAHEKNGTVKNRQRYVLKGISRRWNCVFKKDSGASEIYKAKARLALATVLHKYGFADSQITARALRAIDVLNKEMTLDDAFFRATDSIKRLLKIKPRALTRKPAWPENSTKYRGGDVVSIRVGNKFYVAYVVKVDRGSDVPIIEFYDEVFDSLPTEKDLAGCRSRGKKARDGAWYERRYAIAGMKYPVDPARQMKLIASGVFKAPSKGHLKKTVGLWTLADILILPDIIKADFS